MTVDVRFLGHASFLITSGEHTVAIDPFLSGNPQAAAAPDELNPTHIALTHGHEDHIADAGPIAARTGATLFAAFELCGMLAEKYGLENTEPMNPGGQVRTPFGYIAMTQAFHSSSFEGTYTGMPGGIVVNIGGKTIYHTGDTALFGDMKLIGELYTPDVALICAGDRFTMGPRHAAMAAEMIGAKIAVPMHYGTWPLLAESMSEFRPEGVEARVLKPGETLSL